MKLKLDMPLKDLAFRIGVSLSTVSRVFSSWMIALDVRLSPVVSWPDREDLWRTMPQCFQDSFGKKVTVIIDCFEVFINRPSGLYARAQTFSSYKNHNTVKVLIGITPQGSISFVSKAWGGRTSDKFLTENCGILKNNYTTRRFSFSRLWINHTRKSYVPSGPTGYSSIHKRKGPARPSRC